MKANDTQVGGTHYQSDYQHWDLIAKHNFSYLRGCATKYLCRYRKKNGEQDLEKARHYLLKIRERVVEAGGKCGATGCPQVVELNAFFEANKIEWVDRPAIFWALFGRTTEELDMAINHANNLLQLYESKLFETAGERKG